MPLSVRHRAAAAAVAIVLLAAALGLGLDLDGDGIRSWDEIGDGLSPLDPDSDADGLRDGAERRLGADPRRADTDGDGLVDGVEWRRGSDPTRTDTDGDGILDGHEGHPDCIALVDCDGDGLPDADELAAGYDMLRADTFGIGLPDAVAYAFEQRGQSPTPDDDGDGIPDGWEGGDGAIAWQGLVPEAGRRDLLIEYLRVVGPDSGRYAWLDFTPAYRAVAQMFEAQGIQVQWTETIVHRQVEQRPDFLVPADLDYYKSVLGNGTHSANPYVTSVLLNPQQAQQHGSILGAAFLRSMIATIDYGAHTEIIFADKGGNETSRIRPIVESQIIGGLEFRGYDDGGVTSDGRLFLHRPAQPGNAVQPATPAYTISWRPDWFRSAPYYQTDDGAASLQLNHAGAVLHADELASTIAHELGHTLGLCHLHEAACQLAYGGGFTQADLQASTMSYAAQDTALTFLDPEWEALGQYLRCPPQETTALVAQEAARQDILAAKYDQAFTQATTQRECLDLPVLPAVFVPEEPTRHVAPEVANAGHSGVLGAAILAVVAVALAAGAARLVILRSPRP